MRSKTVFLALSLAACGDNSKAPEDAAPPAAAVGGTVTGLSGKGLVLRINGSDDLVVASSGAFVFAKALVQGEPYTVSIAAQPTDPTQYCTLANPTGIAGKGGSIELSITCTTSSFRLGGTVTGLGGGNLVLQNNSGSDFVVTADGTFMFPAAVASGTAFAATVKTQPTGPSQHCTVGGGTGTIGGADVTSVVVNCETDRFIVGGTISGLAGTVVLKDNGGDPISVTANGSFAFPATVASGSPYAVTIGTQPGTPDQTCVTASGTGVIVAADIASVHVVCTTNKFAVGGHVSGLAGTGLVLRDNAGDDHSIAADGTYTFATTITSGTTYDVTVFGEPSGPTQHCTVANGAGTVTNTAITNADITCATSSFHVGGSVTGLAGSLVLRDNGGDDYTVSADGSFTFSASVASGSLYGVTVADHPTGPSQSCIVTHDSGTIGGADITDVVVTCATNTFHVGGTVTGLAANETVTLRDNGGDDLVVTGNGTFTFAATVASGAPWAATVAVQPASPIQQTCTIESVASGTVGAADITSIDVQCAADPFRVKATVTGLVGTLVLQDNGGDDLTLTADGTYVFAHSVASGAAFSVTVGTPPEGLACSVTGGSGTVGTSDAAVTVTCASSCFSFTNTEDADLIGNTWFDACVDVPGNTVTVKLEDAGGTVVYRASGTKVGTWDPYDHLTSTIDQYGQFSSENHDRAITLDNGDLLMIAGRSASNEGCAGSLGDGYTIMIYPPAGDYTTMRLFVAPYLQQNYDAGIPRLLPGWSTATEILYDSGSPMNSCGSVSGFLGTFSVQISQ